jgi:glucuronate isomerase
MLYSRGIPLERLGILKRDRTQTEQDPRRIWAVFAANYHLFRGTPTRAWLDHELHELFGIQEPLSPDSADSIYDAISERLRSPEYLPRPVRPLRHRGPRDDRRRD